MIKCSRCGWWRGAEAYLPSPETRHNIELALSSDGCCKSRPQKALGS